MSSEYRSEKEHNEANINIGEFLDDLEHGEHQTGENSSPTLSDRSVKLPPEQATTNQEPAAESATSILQMNPPSGVLSPRPVVQASRTIRPYIDPIVLPIHSHAMEALLQPDGSSQVPKSDLEHNILPAILPVQRVHHLRDLISEDAKMGGTINYRSPPPNLSSELHSEERVNSQVLQVEPKTLAGSSNGELDGSSSGLQQTDCPPRSHSCMNLKSLVLGHPELEFQGWLDEFIAEPSTIYPNGSSLLTESPKVPPVCQEGLERRCSARLKILNEARQAAMHNRNHDPEGESSSMSSSKRSKMKGKEKREDCIASMRVPPELNWSGPCSLNHIPHFTGPPQGPSIRNFDLNQLPPSPEIRSIPNSLYDPRYESIGLPMDPILRIFACRKGFYAP